MINTRYAVIEKAGGPEEIVWRQEELAPPAAGEVQVRHTAVGLNFIDTYHRSGLYPIELPGRLGTEAIGVIEGVGDGVDGFAPGDRVGTFGPARGSYATARNVAAAQLTHLPDDIDDKAAAALLLQGVHGRGTHRALCFGQSRAGGLGLGRGGRRRPSRGRLAQGDRCGRDCGRGRRSQGRGGEGDGRRPCPRSQGGRYRAAGASDHRWRRCRCGARRRRRRDLGVVAGEYQAARTYRQLRQCGGAR